MGRTGCDCLVRGTDEEKVIGQPQLAEYLFTTPYIRDLYF